jgi:hypothetical protein
MRTTFLTLSVFALIVPASPFAEAKSEMQCQAEAREVTGEIQGLDYTQAVAACMLDDSQPAKEPSVVIIEKNSPEVTFSGSRPVSFGNWVRVSPHRWVIRPN